MCPQIFRVVRSFSQSFPALFTSGEHSLGDKLLSLDVFRAVGNCFDVAIPVGLTCVLGSIACALWPSCRSNIDWHRV